jgi:hypothetical protein
LGNKKLSHMKLKTIGCGLLAAVLSGLSAYACKVPIRIACPNDNTAANIRVVVSQNGFVIPNGEVYTDGLGIVEVEVPWILNTYDVCVDVSTLPAGATLKKPCQKVYVADPTVPVVEFVLGGTFCEGTPPPGPCWLTGGGTVYKAKGQPPYSFGGVVYPGCSPKAADGGNWNVIDHSNGLHFQGQSIIVDSCSGVSTKSPRVNVNIIDFHGVGILSGIGGNPDATIAVTFIGRCIDNLEPGGGNDQMFLIVSDGVNTVLQIGASAANPATISTGNLQIHTTSCK